MSRAAARGVRRAPGILILPLVAVTIVLSLAIPRASAEDEPSAAGSDGPVKEGSQNVGHGSGSISDATSGSMRSGPLRDVSRSVRDGRDSSMLSGPVGGLGSGPVRDGRSVYGQGSIGSLSQGAVTQPKGLPPLRMERPVTDDEMRQLADDLREIQPLP